MCLPRAQDLNEVWKMLVKKRLFLSALLGHDTSLTESWEIFSVADMNPNQLTPSCPISQWVTSLPQPRNNCLLHLFLPRHAPLSLLKAGIDCWWADLILQTFCSACIGGLFSFMVSVMFGFTWTFGLEFSVIILLLYFPWWSCKDLVSASP